MRPNKNSKFFLPWAWLAFSSASFYGVSHCVSLNAAWAAKSTEQRNQAYTPLKIPPFNVKWVTYQPFSKTDLEVNKFQKLQKQKFYEDAFSLADEKIVKVSAVSLQENSSESLSLYSQPVSNSELTELQHLQDKSEKKLLTALPAVTAAEPNPPPPRENNPQNNTPKSNEPPQLEGQPNEFPSPSPVQIEQRLKDPQTDYTLRLERLLQRLEANRHDDNSIPELGTIIAKPVESPQEPPKTPVVSQPAPASKPIGYLLGRVSYFHTNNLFSSDVDPIQDGLIFSGITLASAPVPLGPKTYLSGSIDGSIIRYINQSEFNYNQFRLNADLYHQFTQRLYGEVGWTNQQLFYARKSDRYGFASGDRFLNENSFHLSLGRRDPLTPKLMLDSYYEFRVNLPEAPQKRNRINNSLWVSLSYYLQQSLNVGLDYQFYLSNFTERDRQDLYHRLFSHLNYKVSDISSVSLQGGVTIGDSTDSTINFDGWFFSVNYSWELGKF
jgi:hypothetical protein